MIRHALLCRHISDIRRPHFLQLVTDSSQTVWPCSVPRNAGLCRCHLLSYSFTEHTFGKSKARRRFLLSNIVVHLVSSALQLLISVTQPLYLATRTDPEIFNFWICMRIRCRPAPLGFGNHSKKAHFSKSPILKKFSRKFLRFVIGLVGLNDAKGIDVAQRIWP